jgi:hypothetical protein
MRFQVVISWCPTSTRQGDYVGHFPDTQRRARRFRPRRRGLTRTFLGRCSAAGHGIGHKPPDANSLAARYPAAFPAPAYRKQTALFRARRRRLLESRSRGHPGVALPRAVRGRRHGAGELQKRLESIVSLGPDNAPAGFPHDNAPAGFSLKSRRGPSSRRPPQCRAGWQP